MRRIVAIFLVVLGFTLLSSTAHAANGHGDRVLFGTREVVVEGEETGDLVVFGGDLDILGKVLGDVVSFGGKVTVSGEITGDLVSMGGGVDLRSTAAIGGNLITYGGVVKEEGARIGGKTKEISPGMDTSLSPISPPTTVTSVYNPLLDLLERMVRFVVVSISLLAVSILVVLFFPAQVELIRETISLAPLWTAAVGFLTIMVALFLTPVLVISLLGIPLVPVLWLVLTCGVFFGYVSLGQLIGERLFEAFRIRRSVPLLIVISGTMLLTIFVAMLSGAFSNCLGIVAITLLSIPGLGAVVLTRFGTMMPRLPR